MDTAQDLVSLSQAKSFLRITDSSQDTEISFLISSASLAIANYLQRDLPSAVRSETRDGNGKQLMMLLNFPITAVSSVLINGVSIPASTGFNTSGYYYDKDTLYLRGYYFQKGQQNIQISYTAGLATVPPPVQQACLYTLKGMYDAQDVDQNITSESVPGAYSASYNTDGIGDIPSGAANLLSPFRRTYWS